MNTVSYLDNDAMNKPDTAEAQAFVISSSNQESKLRLCHNLKDLNN